ncbi:hypothetical protein N658DRAFT_219588 [Parathielavia hyrcaniae]|uniref:Uncharacterized protein n=1 Tax=Parathielavia hyrcaniae TaxID=113614 RepID=A0AAN6PVD0_9PEZI|nr:hypothetical protein N658DRAFT_219588 [Parathielavia hyrcaniae]
MCDIVIGLDRDNSSTSRLLGVLLFRETGSIAGTSKVKSSLWLQRRHVLKYTIPLIQCVSSVSISILNTNNAPFAIILLRDRAKESVPEHLYHTTQATSIPGLSSDRVFPDTSAAQPNGLIPSGRCSRLGKLFLLSLPCSKAGKVNGSKPLPHSTALRGSS